MALYVFSWCHGNVMIMHVILPGHLLYFCLMNKTDYPSCLFNSLLPVLAFTILNRINWEA